MRRLVLSLAVVLAFTVTSFAQTSWQVQTNPSGGPRNIRVDLNGDGYPDLLSGSSALINDQHGGFSGPISTGISSNSISVVLDFDSDGITDYVACNGIYDSTTYTTTDSLDLWHGLGDGTFVLRRSIPLGVSGCQQLVTADLNNDGHPDVVVTSYSSSDPNNQYHSLVNQISVFFGNGTDFNSPVVTSGIAIVGQYESAPNASCYFSGSAAAGDFDNDGHADLMLPTYCDDGDYTDATIEFFRGDGTGHFTERRIVAGWISPNLTALDINQDGRLDLAVLGSEWGPHASGGSQYQALINNADGTFTATTVYSASYYAQDYDNSVDSGVFGDFLGRGVKDALVGYADGADCCNPPTNISTSLFQQNSDGSFTQVQSVSPYDAQDLITGDFDRDGRLDFATYSRDGGFQVFLNRTATAPQCQAPTSNRAVSLCTFANATNPNSIQVLANPTDSRIIHAMKLYIDGVSSFWTPDDLLNHVVSLSNGTHKITAKAWDDLGSFSVSKSITVGTSTPPPGTCSGTANRTVTICSPASGSTVSSPVHIVAGVNDSATVTAVKIYVDGVVAYTTTSKQIDTSIAMSNGSHHITVKAWDASGSFAGSSTFTVGTTTSTCTASSTPGSITICSPAAGQTVSSPVHITAAINDSNASYSGAKAYVDGTAVASTTTKNIDTSVSLAAGLHKLTVKYWEGTTVKSTMSESFTVQ